MTGGVDNRGPVIQRVKRALSAVDDRDSLACSQNEVLEMMAAGVDFRETLSALTKILERHGPGMVCSILLLDSEGKRLRHCVAPSLPEAIIRAADGFPVGPRAGSCGTAVHRREPVFVSDIETDPLWDGIRDVALEHGFRACWSTPIFDANQNVLGTIAVYYRKPELPPEPHLRLAKWAAHAAAICIGRHQSEAALRDSEAQLRTIIETEPECVKLISPTGYLLEMNAAGLRMLEVGSLEEAQRVPIESFIAPEWRAQFLEVSRQVLTDGKTCRLEFELIGLEGTRRWMETCAAPLRNADGSIAALVAVTRDISERKMAADKLKRSEHQFRSLIENAQDLITILAADGTIQFQSPSSSQCLGRAPEDLLQRKIHEFVHPEDMQTIGAAVRRALAEEKPPIPTRFRCRHANGTWRTLEAIGKKLAGSDPPVIVVNSRDITEHRELEEKFLQAQKMEAVGRLAGGLAHDFNNILTVIQCNAAELLSDHGDSGSAETLEEIREIAEAAERAASLTRQLLTFSRKQVTELTPVDLNQIIGNMTRMLQRVLGEDIVLRAEYTPGLPPILADAGMLEQVLMNLAVNSRDAMPRGGFLSIKTGVELVSAAAARCHPDASPGPSVLWTVSDNGVGIPAEDMAHLFEPFFTTKEASKGTGLGLATVYGIVRQHRGWVQVESQPGAGTTVRIHFPADFNLPSSSTEPPPNPCLSKGHESVLLVEDEEIVRHRVAQILERCGYEVTQAASGPDALNCWERCCGEFDLVVTDMVMPGGMNGDALAEQLLQRNRGLKILLTSGYSPETHRPDSGSNAGRSFLQKPFTPQQLTVAVRRCLDSD